VAAEQLIVFLESVDSAQCGERAASHEDSLLKRLFPGNGGRHITLGQATTPRQLGLANMQLPPASVKG
jgi:hypothetical protein